MTSTIEPTTTTEVPAWLNLDGYCPPELRARIAEARNTLVQMRPVLEELGKLCAALQLDLDAHFESTRVELDDHRCVLDPWTGIDSFYDEVLAAADLLAIAVDRIQTHKPTPEWYLDLLQERLDRLPSWAASQLQAAGREEVQA